MKSLEDQIKKLPDVPGIYYFLGKLQKPSTPSVDGKSGRSVLYIGKATSLRSRVRSYFRADLINTRGAWVKQMIERADKVDFKQTDSVLEALILESQEIKKHQPPYNTREKDDKSYLYVVITDEDFPRVLTMREKELREQENSRGSTRHSVLKMPQHRVSESGRALGSQNFPARFTFGPFPYGSELREALKIIRKIFPFRDKCKPGSGKPCFNAQIGLCPGMCALPAEALAKKSLKSEGLIFKREYAKTIRHLKLFFEGKKSQLIKTLEREMRVEAKNLRFEKAGELKRQIFALNHIQDVALIKRDSNLETKFPSSGLTDFFCRSSASGNCRSQTSGTRIEAYDIAHISGKHTVGAMVVMEDGEFNKNSYRKFKVKENLMGDSLMKLAGKKNSGGANDVANLRQILERRLNHPEWPLPNLIVVDGGQAQINVAKLVLENRDLKIPVVGVVKDERHKAREILGLDSYRGSTLESLKVEPRLLSEDIIRLNQEVHRFAIAFHRQRRGKIE